MNQLTKTIALTLLTLFLASASFLLIGPQIMLIGPLVLLAGIALAVCRSYWSLICFGYLMSFGLVSASIGLAELSGFGQTMSFTISALLGIGGVALIAFGLWKGLSVRTESVANVIN